MNRYEQFTYGALFSALDQRIDREDMRVKIEGTGNDGIRRILFSIGTHTLQITVQEIDTAAEVPHSDERRRETK